MKILELRFRNLNSLYGEWVIDFTHPEYVSNGIFSLTGPTGAGKSTILDAICLALYGATPRLGKITKSTNEIMSRQTGECYAEVLFESQAGRFRCHWEQRRARKKAGGNLQNPEHQIVDAATGRPIETRRSLIGQIIVKKTGMDFDRFTRSVLLAQGHFDRFFKADVEDKSRILEQITGTGIYSEISRRVHERRRDEQERLNILIAEISGIEILSQEQETEIRQDLATKQKQEAEVNDKLTKTYKAIKWLMDIEDLKKEIADLNHDAARLNVEIEAFKPKRARLRLANLAGALDGAYATLTALRKQQADDQTSLNIKKAEIPKLETEAQAQAERFKAAQQLTIKCKNALKDAIPLIRKVRLLDQRIAEQSQKVLKEAETCNEMAKMIEKDRRELLKQQKRRNETEKRLGTVQGYLQAHAQDEWLVSGLAGIKEQFGNLIIRQQEMTRKEADIKNAEADLADATNRLETAKRQLEVKRDGLEHAVNALQQAKDALEVLLDGRLLREYRDKKEHLLRELAFIKKIKKLEDERAKLEDGKPCPLCGSFDHPYARGNVPVPDEYDQKIESLKRLITEAETLEADIRKLTQAENAAQKDLLETEKLKDNTENERKATENRLQELKAEHSRLQNGYEGLRLSVLERLGPLGITKIPKMDVSTLLESLETRLNTWQEHTRQEAEIEREIAAIDSKIKEQSAVIETRARVLTERRQDLEQMKADLAKEKALRQEIYGDKNPDNEETRLNRAISDAERNENAVRQQMDNLQQRLIEAQTNIESLKERIRQITPELKEKETGFLGALTPAGFADEKAFLDAQMSDSERDALSMQEKRLDEAKTQLQTRQNDRKARLDREMARDLTDKSLDDLKPQFKEYEEALKALRDVIAGLKHKLSENIAARERIKKKQALIDAQKKEYKRWDMLHGLIGSADGKKFRTFAQGLTFELIVAHANRQLEKMTDRYLLKRDDQQPLELNVIDNYQAGEIRSTRNLSGGEGFIVSLSLALGLSKMASRKVRVDSLFLDEGFGTLDDDALETALETLSGLQQDGKLIGIISHLSALKDRIRTQIDIKPVSGGRSSISGPGCTKVG